MFNVVDPLTQWPVFETSHFSLVIESVNHVHYTFDNKPTHNSHFEAKPLKPPAFRSAKMLHHTRPKRGLKPATTYSRAAFGPWLQSQKIVSSSCRSRAFSFDL